MSEIKELYEKISEMHGDIRVLSSRVEIHIDDYNQQKKKLNALEKRQNAFFAWAAGVGTVLGGGISTFLQKFM